MQTRIKYCFLYVVSEASEVSLNADKRILKCQPFLHRVYDFKILILGTKAIISVKCLCLYYK